MSNVTRILSNIERGDSAASEKLLPLVYEELRKLAAVKLAHEKPGQTLDATALVHEAYLMLVGGDNEPAWTGRGHFFAAAAEAMRRILIQNARRKKTQKRGHDWQRVDAHDSDLAQDQPSERLLELDEALCRFEAVDPLKAKLVKLRYFAGLTNGQTALAMGISTSTADRYWAYARVWLQREMTETREKG